jgi:hypothetical protein
MIGKQPADYHIRILEGTAPAFIREEGQFYEGGPSGVSNKSARHSAIELTTRNPQGTEQPHMPAGASSYMTRGYASGGFAVRIAEQGRWVFAISLACWRRRRIALAAARPCSLMRGGFTVAQPKDESPTTLWKE